MNNLYFLFFNVSEKNIVKNTVKHYDGIVATFQDAATPSAESIVFLYDSTMFYLFVIITVILILLIEIFVLYSYKNNNSNFDIFVNFSEYYYKLNYTKNVGKTSVNFFNEIRNHLFFIVFNAKENLLKRLSILFTQKDNKNIKYNMSTYITDISGFLSIIPNIYLNFIKISIRKISNLNVIEKGNLFLAFLKYYKLSNKHVYGWNLKTINLFANFINYIQSINISHFSSVVDINDTKELYLKLLNNQYIKKLILSNLHVKSQILINLKHISMLMDSRLWIKNGKLEGLDYLLTNKSKEAPVFWKAQRFKHDTKLEFWWTVIPGIILIIIGIPALATIYILDEMITPAITIKANGHQWYWTYNYGLVHKDLGVINYSFDSRMLNDDDLKPGDLRLLEVDYWLLLPINTQIRFLVTGEDVIHSFTVPSFGIKIDGVPGRLNEVPLFIKRKGIYYGQCSELCGVNHGFMPIVVQSVSRKLFSNFFSIITKV